MSTIKKLDPRVRRNQTDRNEKARWYQQRAGWETKEELAAYAAAEALIEIIRDPSKTGETKESITKRIWDEYKSNTVEEHVPISDGNNGDSNS